MLDGYGNRIGPHPVYMTDYGPVEITDIDPRSYKMLEMTALNGDMPALSIYSVFARHLAAHAEAAQINGVKPAPVSFSEWKRTSAAAASILGHGQRQHDEAALKFSRIVPPGWNPRSIIDSQKLPI